MPIKLTNQPIFSFLKLETMDSASTATSPAVLEVIVKSSKKPFKMEPVAKSPYLTKIETEDEDDYYIQTETKEVVINNGQKIKIRALLSGEEYNSIPIVVLV